MRKQKNELPLKLTQKAKLPKRVTTVEDVLASDEINYILSDLNKEKPHISDLIVIYTDRRDGQLYFQTTRNTLVSMATWMLEATKFDLLNEGEEE